MGLIIDTPLPFALCPLPSITRKHCKNQWRHFRDNYFGYYEPAFR